MDKMHRNYYRAVWTCGRYDKESHSAILFNLIAGLSFFFEDSSADVVGIILRTFRGQRLNTDDIINESGFSSESVVEFLGDLADFGLITYQSHSQSQTDKYRRQIKAGKSLRSNVNKKTDAAEFPSSEAEKAYVKRVNNRASVVMMELTYECSESCIHCFNPGAARNDREKSNRKRDRHLSLEQYKRIIDEMYDEGTFKVCLTGGDPFSNPYVWQIIDYLYEKEIAFEIFTNAQSLAGNESRLADYFPFYVAVSIYSMDASVHDTITRRKHSLDKSLDVLYRLNSYCVPLIIKCVIMQHNFKSYPGVMQLAQKLNAEIQFDCRLIDSLDGDRCVSNFLRLTPEQLRIALRDKNSLYYVGKELQDFGRIHRSPDEPACQVGFNNLCITPDGYVIPCCCFHAVIGDLVHQSLHSILHENKFLEYLTTTTLSQYEECGRYEYCDFCILCPGVNFAENGTPLKASENNCYYAKARYNLYLELLQGKDPLKDIDLTTALADFPEYKERSIKRVGSAYHWNEELNVSNS